MQTPRPSDRPSIRYEMRGTIESGIVLSRWDDEQIMFAAKITDLILECAVIRRIQADTLRDAADLMLDAVDGLPFDDDHDRAIPSAWLEERADRIEKDDDQ